MGLLHNLKPVELIRGLHRLVVEWPQVVAVELQGLLLSQVLLV